MIYITSNRGIPVYGIKTFLLDSKSDITGLPTQGLTPGSKAFVTEDSSTYILNTSREWVKTINSGAASDSGEIRYEGGDINIDNPNTDEDVDYEGGDIGGQE